MPRVIIDETWPSDFREIRERLSRLFLQSVLPHSREDPIVIVVDSREIGTRGWLAWDIAHLLNLKVEVRGES